MAIERESFLQFSLVHQLLALLDELGLLALGGGLRKERYGRKGDENQGRESYLNGNFHAGIIP